MKVTIRLAFMFSLFTLFTGSERSIVLAQSSNSIRYAVTPITGQSNVYNYVYGLNNVGQVLGRTLMPFGGLPFLWQDGTFSSFDTGDDFHGLNDAGTLVGGAAINNVLRCIVWKNGILSTLDPTAGFLNSSAYAINAQGTIAGYSYNISSPQPDADFHACIWQNGIPVNLGTLPNYPLSSAAAINSQNAVVGTCSTYDSVHAEAYIWSSQSGMQGLGHLPGGAVSAANALNSAGKVVGNCDTGNYEPQAFLWVAGLGMSNLGTLPGDFSSTATGINDTDQIVGYSTGLVSSQVSRTHAVLWTAAEGIHDLNDLIDPNSGCVLTEAMGINNRGQIVANGYSGNTAPLAYLLTPVAQPLPTSVIRLTDNLNDPTRSVDGIVCDNLSDMPDARKDNLTLKFDKAYAAATNFSVTALNENHSTTDTGGHPNAGDVARDASGNVSFTNGALTYCPPNEFNYEQQPSSADATQITKAATRTIYLKITFTCQGTRYEVDEPIILARPPVVLVHGINSCPSNWLDLLIGVQSNMGVRMPFAFVDHSDQQKGNGPVEYGASKLAQTISSTLSCIRNGQALPGGSVTRQVTILPSGPVITYPQGDFTDYSNSGLHLAIQHVDVVGWSYGGVITRWFIASNGTDPGQPNDPANSWYKRFYGVTVPHVPAYDGSIRKFITLGSMWRGVPLVNYLNEVAFDNYPSPGGVYLGNAPVNSDLFSSIVGWELNVHNLKQLVDFISGNFIPTYVPSMEVMAVNSPWESYLTYRNASPGIGPIFPQPYNPDIAYGSVAGDDEAYLGLDGLNLLAPYAFIDQIQRPSWFPCLPLEHLPGAIRNYSDGLIPLWSAALPGSYKIAPVNHSNYPKDPDTQAYLVQWLSNASLPTGKDLTAQWNTSVQSFDKNMTWTFASNEMAPHTQNMLYPQWGGIGRINPAALLGNSLTKPVIKISRIGTPQIDTNNISFALSVQNTGASAYNLRITSISFYQSLIGAKYPYNIAPISPIGFLGPAQTLNVSASSLIPISTSHLFCTVNYQFSDQQGNVIQGSITSIVLK